MASSAAVVSPPPPKPSSPDIDDGDEDIEYEEIEEEIEVEEEVEVEVEEEIEEEVEAENVEEGGEDEIGEDLTPVREENQENDANQIMELEEHEEHIQSGSVTQGISVSNPLNDILKKDVGDVKTSESSEKEELHVNGERTSRDNDPKAPFYDSGEVNHAKRTPFIGDVNSALVMVHASRENDNAIVSVMRETNHTAIEAVANVGQMSPRLRVPQVRFRDPSSSAEFDGENKKLRIVCEFHAKGWCIKGNSCRFLHIKDGLDAVVKKSEVLEREASSSACILPQQSGENPKLNSETEKLVLRKDDTLGSAPLQAGRGSFGHNLYLDNYSYHAAPLIKGSLIERNSTYHGHFSSCSVTSHDNHHITRISAFGTLEEMISKKSDIVRSDPRSADLPYTHSRQPLSFGSSSWNTDALGTQNLLESGLERHVSVSSSLQRSISPVSRSESESLSRNYIFRDTEMAKSKTKSSSDDWEPSVPFRPSHVITRNLLLKESLYDPIRDSIEQMDVRDGRVKFSHSDQGSSVKNVNVQSNSSQEEEKLLNSVHVGDTVKDNMLSSSCDNKLKFDKPRHKTVLKVDGFGKNDETDVDFKRDGHMQSESKALKYFQSALIEFVKELVKPTWREGFLSKDAHKVIVKKAVEKVLSTLQPHQIPSTGESIKLYLSSSQPKLAKLVEGYIDKYGKS
ncbi:hypothetical protein Pfo_012903 [Paulownia fortunei]|nr:hypothetical protein Pfo_012903 [Paulownia fortunei]